MKTKQIVQLSIDAVMFVLFLLLMEQHLISDAAHEWLGLSLFVAFLIHNAMNYRWYTVLFKGKYGVVRVIQTATNLVLWLAMIGCFVSSLMISGTVFSGLVIPGARYGAMIHMLSTAWAFVLISLHLGLHWVRFTGMARRVKLKEKPKKGIIWIFRTVVLALCAVGIWVFISRAFYEELFLITEYKAYDYGADVFVYLLQTVALSVLFVSLAYYGKKLCLYFSNRRREANE